MNLNDRYDDVLEVAKNNKATSKMLYKFNDNSMPPPKSSTISSKNNTNDKKASASPKLIL